MISFYRWDNGCDVYTAWQENRDQPKCKQHCIEWFLWRQVYILKLIFLTGVLYFEPPILTKDRFSIVSKSSPSQPPPTRFWSNFSFDKVFFGKFFFFFKNFWWAHSFSQEQTLCYQFQQFNWDTFRFYANLSFNLCLLNNGIILLPLFMFIFFRC